MFADLGGVTSAYSGPYRDSRSGPGVPAGGSIGADTIRQHWRVIGWPRHVTTDGAVHTCSSKPNSFD